jgi:hypothetical protein
VNTLRRTLALGAAALAAIVLAAVASAATELKEPLQTGNWWGTVTQEIGLDEPHTSKVTFVAYKGRLVGIAARIRMECDDESWTDAQVSKSWRIGKGPKLTPKGSFFVNVNGVAFDGNLGKVLAEGTVKARVSGCHGDGFWKAKKRSI